MTTWNEAERAALVALLRARPGGIKWPEIVLEVAEAGSARTVWERHSPPALFDSSDSEFIAQASADISAWENAGLRFLTFLDPEYPAQLREIHQAPPFLFCKGKLESDSQAVSVVGSRKASERGLEIATNLARTLADSGITVISGLAAGIDAAAHTETLRVGGRAVAVIGTGINRNYPAANSKLQAEIADSGLLMSQFWPDAPPQKHTFLMRNATMSGYGKATIVVEAGETSGARAQARMAVEHGRPVILTDLVVEKNEWAQTLAARPGVYVASSTDDVMKVVRHVTRSLDDVVGSLLPVSR
ncbi:DNA-processing protein DprA [Lentzea indica]|uniref:DNA-processing protein DprA n=1 Tax=Lentzea indica TaxID=2604800 RepID=UPI001CB7581F|nr:DNA-processing protein DprA [Lentzea indica]